MLPDQGDIADALDSLAATGGPGMERATGVPASKALSVTGVQADPAIYFWYLASGGVSIKSLISRVGAELKRAGHVDDETIVLALLTLVAFSRRPGVSAARQVNELLSHVTDARLMQFYVFPGPGDVDIQVGSFRIAPLAFEKLAYWSERSGSDYFQLWGDRLKGRAAIERSDVAVKVLPLNEAGRFLGAMPDRAAVARIVGHYFGAVARALVPGFWDALVEEQDLFVACGAPFVPEEPLKMVPACDMVTVFSRIGGAGRGWVAPVSMGPLTLEFGFSVSEHRRVEQILRNEYQLLSKQTGPMHDVLRTYVRFLARARRYEQEQQIDEALLHAVIALEMLLVDQSQEQSIGGALGRRAAVLTCQALKQDYTTTRRSISQFYDARSAYVHAGKPARLEHLADARRVCEAVLYCLFRLHSRPSPESLERGAWLKQIDLMAAHLEAGETPLPELVARLGIAPSVG